MLFGEGSIMPEEFHHKCWYRYQFSVSEQNLILTFQTFCCLGKIVRSDTKA